MGGKNTQDLKLALRLDLDGLDQSSYAVYHCQASVFRLKKNMENVKGRGSVIYKQSHMCLQYKFSGDYESCLCQKGVF